MPAVLARAAAAFVVIGCLCYGFSAVTGSPVFEQCFWEVARFTLMIAIVLAGFAALVLGTIWLLLSDRSPIPSVRSRWTRHLTPVREKGSK
jgi:hypothetical protein